MLKEMLDTLQKLPQRKALKSLDIDVSKPLIAIVTVSSEDSLANNEISVIVEKVKDGLSQSGAVSKVINCASREFSTAFGTQISKYELPMREYYANSVEFVCASDIYDGIVFVVSQPMAAAGLLIGAVRMNMPCMFVSQGVMSPIEFEGQHTGYLSMYTEIGELKTGRINHEKMELIENSLPLSLGTDCETYGENSFNCVLEVMGLSIKNNGSAPAHTVERYKIARATGNAIVEMIKNKLTLKTLLTSQVLLTATATDLAIGGSATTLLNMLALSKELGLKNLTMDTIEELAKNTPVLVDCSDSALSFMEQFHSAGATYAVLRELEKNQIIRCDYTIFNGKSMSSTL
ncbi:MAG: dihydroxy-acid dehydratase, partial [Clostridia bacterium]